MQIQWLHVVKVPVSSNGPNHAHEQNAAAVNTSKLVGCDRVGRAVVQVVDAQSLGLQRRAASNDEAANIRQPSAPVQRDKWYRAKRISHVKGKAVSVIIQVTRRALVNLCSQLRAQSSGPGTQPHLPKLVLAFGTLGWIIRAACIVALRNMSLRECAGFSLTKAEWAPCRK